MSNEKNYFDDKNETEAEMVNMRKQVELVQRQIDLQNELLEKKITGII